MLLDEVDKLGSDYRGDPSAALLEVLDGEQNSAFRDHYIEVPYDLSKVLFVATAKHHRNHSRPAAGPYGSDCSSRAIPGRRSSRLPSGTWFKKQLSRHGLDSKRLHITDGALYAIIDSYTREAGVRNLERKIGEICRKSCPGAGSR